MPPDVYNLPLFSSRPNTIVYVQDNPSDLDRYLFYLTSNVGSIDVLRSQIVAEIHKITDPHENVIRAAHAAIEPPEDPPATEETINNEVKAAAAAQFSTADVYIVTPYPVGVVRYT